MPGDDHWWDVTRYYLFFQVLNLILSYLIYRAWRDHVKTWRVIESRWQIALLLLAALLILFATGVQAFLFFISYSSWRSALDPSTPAPMFEIFWIMGLFAVTVPAAFAGMLQTFVRKEYDDLIP